MQFGDETWERKRIPINVVEYIRIKILKVFVSMIQKELGGPK